MLRKRFSFTKNLIILKIICIYRKNRSVEKPEGGLKEGFTLLKRIVPTENMKKTHGAPFCEKSKFRDQVSVPKKLKGPFDLEQF